jgi:hypothetical protein
MERDPANDFAFFCVIAAGLRDRTFGERTLILQGLGLEGRWPGIQSQWAHLVLDEIGRGDLVRVGQLAEVCAHDRVRRAEGDDAFAPASTGEPITPTMIEARVPMTLVGWKPATIAPGPPSVTMDSDVTELEGEPESPGGSVPVEAPHTLNMGELARKGEPTTLIPSEPRKLTARSAHDPGLEATRRAMRWSVEHYAAFAASLTLAPSGVEGVASEFEVPAELVAAINNAWARRIEKDPVLRRHYLVHYEASLQQRKPTS